MYAKARQDGILEILKKHGYVTVQYLTEKLHYSTATINRDLNALQKQGLVKRSYGGAELVAKSYVPLPFRHQFMRVEKRKIGQAAAALVKPDDVIFMDASTTTQYMATHLIEISGIRVITNNMSLALYLSEHGVSAVCLGGPVSEPPSMLFGEETVMNASLYKADKLFFSTGSVTSDGMIGGGNALLTMTMAKNSDKVFFLADHKKVNRETMKFLFDFSKVDCVISDYDFPEETKKNFPDTEFVKV